MHVICMHVPSRTYPLLHTFSCLPRHDDRAVSRGTQSSDSLFFRFDASSVKSRNWTVFVSTSSPPADMMERVCRPIPDWQDPPEKWNGELL